MRTRTRRQPTKEKPLSEAQMRATIRRAIDIINGGKTTPQLLRELRRIRTR